jgi:hypothetical protein
MRARKKVTTGSSKVSPKASSMRAAKVRYSLMRIVGSDLKEADLEHQPIFVPGRDEDDIQGILCQGQPWYENDTGRLEFINRIRLWRYLLGDDRADAHYWMTRLENVPGGG